MALPAFIEDKATKRSVKVTSDGQLVVGPLAYSEAHNVSMVLAATEYEVVKGLPSRRFVITDMLIITLKSVSPSAPATIILYEADVSDLTTNLKTIVEIDMVSQDRLVAVGMNLVTSGDARSIVGTTTDGTVTVTLAGYYIPPD